jgi:uroporphyrinogen III methyltransferase / synthase
MNLTGKRIVITRPRRQAKEFANALIAEGAQPIYFPVIEIASLNDFTAFDSALLKLDQYDWLILTSIHGVDVFFKRLEVLDIKQLPQHLQVAAIGTKTARCLYEHWVAPNFIPNEHIAEAILPGLGEDISGKRFLLPQSDLAREFLAKEIRSAGGIVDEIVAYHTRTANVDSSSIDSLRKGIDIITFASPSSIKSFANILLENNFDMHCLPGNPLIASIGPVTAAAVREIGLQVHVEAKEHTMIGLVNVLKEM